MTNSNRGIAIVTGAGGGIGAACAKRLSRDGYSLILVGRDLKKLEKTSASLDTPNVCVALDLTQKNSVDQITLSLKNSVFSGQKLTLIVNNAGIINRKSFQDLTEHNWREEMEINFLTPVLLLQKLIPLMNKSGVIINVTSTLGLRPVVNTAAYSASKAALNNLTQTLALELAPHIRVCGVCPGLVDTPIHSFFGQAEQNEDRRLAHAAQPMKRMGKPEEVAAMVSFLAGPDSGWTTGSLQVVDGGISLI